MNVKKETGATRLLPFFFLRVFYIDKTAVKWYNNDG